MARKETMAEKYCKMKKISIQNIALLSSWTLLLVTSSSAVQLSTLAEQLNSKVKLTHWSVLKFHQTHTHSTLDVKSSLKQMDVWIVSTKNTVSNKNQHRTTSLSGWFLISVSFIVNAQNKRLGYWSQPLFFILMELHSTIYDNGLSCDVVWIRSSKGSWLLLLHLLVQKDVSKWYL